MSRVSPFPAGSMLGHPLIGTGANPVSDAGTFPHRSQPFLHDEQVSFVPPYVPADVHSSQAYPAGCLPLIQSPGPFPFPRFNLATTASLASSNPTLRGPENFRSVPVIANKETICINHGTAIKGECNVPSDPSYRYDPSITRSPLIKFQPDGTNHLYALPKAMPQGRAPSTRVHKTTPTFAVPLTPPGNLYFLPVTRCQDKAPSRDLHQRSRQLGKEPTTASPARSPALSSRSASARKNPKGPYPCESCYKTFAYPQVLYRHQREKHEPDWCIFCGDFKWARPYLLKDHLIKKHPELDTDAALDDAMKARRRATTTTRRSTLRQDPSSAAKPHQQDYSDSHAGSFHAKNTNVKTGVLYPLQTVEATHSHGMQHRACVWDSKSVEEEPFTAWEAEG
ncbi:hypothetical protein BJV78DRAFT_242258 [Lactifluus subvellereus]|nr:hypothetical protein BJV78DRAFT_242258 [Lactifluus subvellereus]